MIALLLVACDLEARRAPADTGEAATDSTDTDVDTAETGDTAECVPVDEVCGDGIDQDCDGGDVRCALAGALSTDDADAVLHVDGGSSGIRLATGGDLDGDGVPDLVVGTPDADGGRGRALVIAGPIEGEVDLASASEIEGASDAGYFGFVAPRFADLTGDGAPDLLVQATTASWVYAVEGPVTASGPVTHAAAWYGAGVGAGGLAAGDFDGDGFADAAMGCPNCYNSGEGAPTGNIGGVWVDFGPCSGELYLATSYGDAWVWGDGAGEGRTLAAGDLDGDGADELVVNAPSFTGAYVVAGGTVPARGGLAATAAAVVRDTDASHYAGRALSVAEDVDGDGYGDLLIGAFGDTTYGSTAGAVHVLAGPHASWPEDLADAAYASLHGAAGDGAGWGVAAEDVDGDGRADVLVGGSGAAWLVYGPPDPGAARLADADATVGGLTGATEVTGGGDLSGTGHGTLLAWEPAGDVYAYFGAPR